MFMNCVYTYEVYFTQETSSFIYWKVHTCRDSYHLRRMSARHSISLEDALLPGSHQVHSLMYLCKMSSKLNNQLFPSSETPPRNAPNLHLLPTPKHRPFLSGRVTNRSPDPPGRRPAPCKSPKTAVARHGDAPPRPARLERPRLRLPV